MTEFSKDCLRFCVRVGNDRPETFNIATANNPDANIASLASFALAQIERAERAEATIKDYLIVRAERDRLAKELAEAEEAILGLTDAGDAMRFSMPDTAMAGKSGWDDARQHPAIRRARERGKG